ncbi:MAG: hypothetical protein NZ853_00935 [Leptospiraceae bacterium]|nr:hypothetical protein [Leptospiraceae bacterium]MDW7976206.1 hypothetical protein [Leptospiraceae bacterium]
MNKIIIFMVLILMPIKIITGNDLNAAKLEEKLQAIINSNIEKRKEIIETLTKEDVESLISYIRYKYISKEKELEIIFSLYDQLANIKAIELSQKRLNRLLIVIFLTLVLFSFYLSYILVSQKKILKRLETEIEKKTIQTTTEIFRG